MNQKANFDIVIIGGGCSGFAAGIQAARMGAKTLIVEETLWLGGMITSAGVSAFDGNKYALGSGIFGELRKRIEDHYGGPENIFTGWISFTCFEPSVAAYIIKDMVDQERNLTVWYQAKFRDVIKDGNTLNGAIVEKEGELYDISCKVLIEATEYGDVLEYAEIPYRIGRDTKEDTGEEHAPDVWDEHIQDITFCATLQKFDREAPRIIPSNNYDPKRFKNSTAVDSDTTDEEYLNHKLHSWDSFISYAALPNNKYLLNWPFRSNDYPTTLDIFLKPETRQHHYKLAKELTLDYIYYIQKELNHPEWGLAHNEYPTVDGLPFIPYVRESRRVKGVSFMVEKDVIPVKGSYRPPLVKSSIAVGDYFLDHHHSLAHLPPDKRLIENYPDNAPFQIPMEVLIPESVDGIVVAEKSISVSHIVNGCSRLQPVVVLIGQAAGVLAALSVFNNKQPRDINYKDVQEVLLNAGCQLFPYTDVYNYQDDFKEVQLRALKGDFRDSPEFKYRING